MNKNSLPLFLKIKGSAEGKDEKGCIHTSCSCDWRAGNHKCSWLAFMMGIASDRPFRGWRREIMKSWIRIASKTDWQLCSQRIRKGLTIGEKTGLWNRRPEFCFNHLAFYFVDKISLTVLSRDERASFNISKVLWKEDDFKWTQNFVVVLL